MLIYLWGQEMSALRREVTALHPPMKVLLLYSFTFIRDLNKIVFPGEKERTSSTYMQMGIYSCLCHLTLSRAGTKDFSDEKPLT